VLASYFLSRDLPFAEYRDACYARNGLLDRFSVVAIEPGGAAAVALNLYRSERRGPLSPADREQLLRCGPLLAAAAARHVQMLRPACGDPRDLLARIPAAASLSTREAQLCCLLLDGLTVDAAADRMGIKPTTAITLKKRAFARLGARTRQDLLRLAAVHRTGSAHVIADGRGSRPH
jgi:DNA-binding CsgD family transcriptional regulator